MLAGQILSPSDFNMGIERSRGGTADFVVATDALPPSGKTYSLFVLGGDGLVYRVTLTP